MHHTLEATPETVHDVFSNELPPVLQVDSGDTLTVGSRDASGYLERPADDRMLAPRLIPDARGHCLTGPVRIAGAHPGDMIAVRVEALEPDDWGWTSAAAVDNWLNQQLGVSPDDKLTVLWSLEHGRARSAAGFAVRLAPFLGVIGLAPAEPGEHLTFPPRATGGNIDCRELVAGSTLYLPVAVEGALLSLGDGHGAQGDGEVCGTAVECAMTTRLGIEVVRDRPVRTAHADTPAGRITFGFDTDLNVASAAALSAMLDWLCADFAITRPEALAYASVAVDLRVTQIVNRTWGVHAVLPPDTLLR